MSGVPSLQISSRPPLPLRSDVAASAADVRITAAFRAHRDRLRSVLLRSGLGTGDAEDVTQEAFWVFAQRVSDVPEFAERAFLMNTALRLVSDRRRPSGTMPRAMSGRRTIGPRAVPTPRSCVRVTTRGAVWTPRVVTLADDERDVFVLVELEGLSRSEAAYVLHLAPGTVASSLARARARLAATSAAQERLAAAIAKPLDDGAGAVCAMTLTVQLRWETNRMSCRSTASGVVISLSRARAECHSR